MIKEIFQYRDLLWMLILRDIRIRYKQAAMGFVWAIFMPIVAISAGVLIRKAMAVVSGEYVETLSIVSIAVKVLPWTFFISSIRFSVQSLVGNRDLVTKIYFPKAVLPLAAVFACFLDFCVSVAALSVILTFLKLGVSIYMLWLPLIVLSLVLLTVGLGLFLSSSNLFFRDIKYIVEIILMFGIFYTPVFYSADQFGNWKQLLLLNPIGSLLESINHVVVLKQAPDFLWLGYAGFVSLVIFYFGIVIFHKQESVFAEYV
ncbi:MAG: hypothetical protein A3D10_08855 [Omnitrophica WOR_2 bacterium RIFCSPHIGHO2_02_FULL_48_11]|nr:MAG: hypothetical protein A3D10_08855 [Omnitrophica WOR_2 bacterium RIFCSPHIGHO2_02_FULL_48_11]